MSREGRGRVTEPLVGNTEVSETDERVHETTTDSRAGAAMARDELHVVASLSRRRLVTRGYRRLRKDSAPGYDGQTVADYGKDFETTRQSLLDRAKSGTYLAPPVRRVQSQKARAKTPAPLGFRPRKTSCCNVQSLCSWTPSMNRIFLTAHMGFARVGPPMGRSAPYGASA